MLTKAFYSSSEIFVRHRFFPILLKLFFNFQKSHRTTVLLPQVHFYEKEDWRRNDKTDHPYCGCGDMDEKLLMMTPLERNSGPMTAGGNKYNKRT